MTASALLHHLFPWEIAPGVARDDQDPAAASPEALAQARVETLAGTALARPQ